MKQKRRSALINNAAKATPTLRSLTCNVQAEKGLVRNATMEGREYLVCPMVMIVEGVLNGDGGALFYPGEELAKIPAVWNHKPVVVYHPEIAGKGTSACAPDILTAQKVGVIMNTQWDAEKHRLTAEAWIEPSRANVVDGRIMEAIQNEETLELSTGVFVEVEPAEGEHNGKAYSGIARNYRPDHLALLPDQLGACSVADGAGFIRNALHKETPAILAHKALLDVITHRAAAELAKFVPNEASFDDVRQSLWTALRVKHGLDVAKGALPDLWIVDVYPERVIYEWESKLWSIDYVIDAVGTASLQGEAVQVKRVTEYKTLDGITLGSGASRITKQTKPKGIMNKEELIGSLIANHGWSEADRPALNALSEEQLSKLIPAPVANAEQPKSVEEYIAKAPADMQKVLKDGVTIYNERRGQYIAMLKANKRCKFTDEQLASFPLSILNAAAALISEEEAPASEAQPTANYSGAAAVPTANASAPEPLTMPLMDFTK